MACCVGLKRPHPELDHLDSPVNVNNSPTLTPKRRRPLGSVSPPVSSGHGSNLPISLQQQHQRIVFAPFGESNIPELQSDAIANQIREEMKRFQNRRQLNFNNPNHVSPPSTSSGWLSSSSPAGFTAPSTNDVGVGTDKPLFTFDQVHQICGRMLQDRETVLRDWFQKILTAKLDEQYETFVKFAQDQLRGMAVSTDPTGEETSYLS